MDLGIQATKDFEQQVEDCRADILRTQTSDEAEDPQGSREEDKPDAYYATILPEYLLPKQHRPQHHKPDIIRAVGYYVDPVT